MAEEVIAIKTLKETQGGFLSGIAAALILAEVVQGENINECYKEISKWQQTLK